MSRLFILTFVWCICCAAFSNNVAAADSKAVDSKILKNNTAPGRQSPKIIKERDSAELYKVIPVDLNIYGSEHIAPGVEGQNIKSTVELISSFIGRAIKGEFETSRDFEQRKDVLYGEPYVEDRRLGDLIQFVLPLSKEGPFKYRYDADAGKVTFIINTSKTELNGIGHPNYSYETRHKYNFDSLDVLKLHSDVIAKGEYVGENAYGAKTTVQKADSIDYGLAFRRLHLSDLSIPLLPTEASRIIPGVKLVIAYKSLAPFLAFDYRSIKPNRDVPLEGTVNSKYLYGYIKALAIYSSVDGRVLAKWFYDVSSNPQSAQVETINGKVTWGGKCSETYQCLSGLICSSGECRAP